MTPEDTPFHAGELHVQGRTQLLSQAQRSAAMISDSIPGTAIAFIAQQCFAVVGSLDDSGRPWASILVGEPGFINARDERSVLIDNSRQLSSMEDPLWRNIQKKTEVGVLLINLFTRHRLRINGTIQVDKTLSQSPDKRVYKLAVKQAYPNCPKHIQQRQLALDSDDVKVQTTDVFRGKQFEDRHIDLVANADTFFVASSSPGYGVDASHRGGKPGFVALTDGNKLRIPDYQGNSFFNTLGNFVTYPLAGLLFIDFEHSRSLQLTGKVRILWDQHDGDNLTGGTGRFWEFELTRWIEAPLSRQLVSRNA